MSIKKQIKKLEHYQVVERSFISRFGAVALTALTLFGVADLGHEHGQQVRREITLVPHYSLASAAENETVRMPIKFDDGLRAPATAGE